MVPHISLTLSNFSPITKLGESVSLRVCDCPILLRERISQRLRRWQDEGGSFLAGRLINYRAIGQICKILNIMGARFLSTGERIYEYGMKESYKCYPGWV